MSNVVKKPWMRTLSFMVMVALLATTNMPIEAAAKKYVKGLKVAKTSVELEEGKNVKVNVTVKTVGSAKKTIRVKSSSSAVALAKAGKTSKKGVTPITITAKKSGSATITVTTVAKNNKKKKLSKKITVTVTASGTSTPDVAGTPSVSSTPVVTGTPNVSSTPVVTGTPNVSSTPVVTETPRVTETPNVSSTPDASETPIESDTPDATDAPSESTSDEVEWTVSEEPYEGSFSQVDPVTNETQNFPIQLLRKYVSFNPWPTTNEQVEYVIKNCDDPYVIAALYVVALDNYEYVARGDYSGETYKMIESLMNGAGAVTGTNYVLNSFDKQHINEFGTKKCEVKSGDNVLASSFASRTFLKGATPYNGYTPEGGLEDKTKWKIIIDQYPYCFDQENEVKKYITLCPRRYTEEQEYENGPLIPVEHSQVARIGFRWNASKKVWLPTDYVSINTDPGSSPLVPYNIKASILFSNDYKAPQEDQGW